MSYLDENGLKQFYGKLMARLNSKVDKVTGKQLTTNDYSNSEKAVVADVNSKKHSHSNKSVLDKLTQAMLDKLTGIAAGAEVNVQSDWSVTDTGSDAYIKNKPTSMPASDVSSWAKAASKPSYGWTEITGKPSVFNPSTHTHTKSQISDMPTKLSQFTNDSGYLTTNDIDASQNHSHANKTVLDKITQAMLDKLAGIADGANKYVHPSSGVKAGTYQNVTVNAQGHVTGGTPQGPFTWNQIHGSYTWDQLKGV